MSKQKWVICGGAGGEVKYLHPDCRECRPEKLLGYVAEADRAERRIKRGMRQVYCKTCKRYRWPHERKKKRRGARQES